MIPKRNSSFVVEEMKSEYIKSACMQLVAFIEVTALIRILKADFQFFNVNGKLYISNILNFIYSEIEGEQLTMVHDRYHPMEQIKLKEVASKKQGLDDL